MLTRILVMTATLCAATGSAEAQSFGRNKVQYERFQFSILQTPHFDIYYYSAEREAAHLAAPMAERWHDRLSSLFSHRFERRQPIILYASHGHFTQTSIVDGLREGIGGFTDGVAGRVVLPFAATLGETDHVLGHELVHAFQRDILRKRGRSLASLPLWFAEGMAEQISVGRLDPHTEMWLRDAVEHGGLPTLSQLSDPRWFPYRYGQGLWSFLESRFGPEIYARALLSRASGGGLGRLEAATGQRRTALTRSWHEWMTDRVRRPTDASTGGTSGLGQPAPVVETAQHGGRLNVGPALSPDGRWLVFLSERDGFSMDVYLAEVSTRRVTKRLTTTAVDPHFDSLQFLDSAGAWDPAGERFVLATVRDGRPVLTLFSMPDGGETASFVVEDVDQAFSPTWSPDGTQLAFSATVGGVSDLYIYDLERATLRAVTRDVFADLQPAWSPRGDRLAFVTDRFSSTITDARFGRLEIALVEIESGAIRRLGGLPGGKNIDPHWDPSGRGLYFVADGGGASNVHWIDADTRVVAAVSDVSTGVSGVTATSPAIAVASTSGAVAMSVYSKGTIGITVAAAPNVVAPTGRSQTVASSVGADGGAGATASAQPAAAVPTRSSLNGGATIANGLEVSSRRYSPSLSLVSLGQPYLTAGGGALGGFLRAGASVSMTDVLAQHAVHAAVQVGRHVTDFAVQGSYVNRRSRLNWGLVGGQVPAIAGVSETTATRSGPGGDPVIVKQSDVLHTIHRQASTVFSYPFNRGLRLELSAGADQVSFEQRQTIRTFAATSGALTGEERLRRRASSAMLLEGGTALVYDASIMGPTGPLLGQRYRVAVAPTMGDVTVVTTAADYRRYWMPARPFTLALRLQHVSRYGPSATDPRLIPLVWTLRDLVRGYATPDDLLRTRRLTAGNVELRAPIPGVFRRELRHGSLPLTAFAFADWGRFSSALEPDTVPLLRTLWSAGAGARVNAAGFVFEFSAARTFDLRPGWRLAVNFRPGF